MSDLMRDPKSGRMLSRLETDVKQAALAAEGFGLPKESQQMLAMKGRVADDTPAVQEYISQLVDLVREFRGPVGELKLVLPLLLEISAFAAKDKTLSEAQRRRISGISLELQALIAKKLSLFTRTSGLLKRVARKKSSQLRDAAIEHGQNSDSGLLRLGARVLSRREGAESEQKNILQTRADVLQNILSRKQAEKPATPKVRGVKGGSGPISAKDFAAEPEFEKPKKKSPKKVVDEEAQNDQSALLTHILDTERDVLTELKVLTKTLRGQTDDMHQDRDETARQAERQTEALGKLSPKQVGKPTETKAKPADGESMFKSLIGMLGFGKIGGVVDKFMSVLGDTTGLIGKMLLPALTTMAQGALLVGAAFAGWKLGTWLDEKVGNKLSDAVGRATAYLMGGKEQVKVYDDMRNAQKGITPSPNVQKENEEKSRLATTTKTVATQNSVPMATSVQLNPQTLGHVPSAGAPTPAPAPKVAPPTPPTAPVTKPSTSPVKQAPFVMDSTPYGPATPPKDTTPKKVPEMEISKAGLSFLQDHEGGFYAEPYDDKGGLAIGYGSHTFKGKSVNDWVKGNPNFKITKAEADADMKDRLKREFYPAVRKSLTGPISQKQFDALVSIAWNRGVGAYGKDKSFIEKVNKGTATTDDFRAAHGPLNDKLKKGIEKRRGEEYALYSGNDTPTMRKANLSNRNAGAIATMTAANQSKAPTILAPQTIIANKGNSGGQTTYVPVPVRPKNADATFRAVQTLNEM